MKLRAAQNAAKESQWIEPKDEKDALKFMNARRSSSDQPNCSYQYSSYASSPTMFGLMAKRAHDQFPFPESAIRAITRR
jgi:hypothetical protein